MQGQAASAHSPSSSQNISAPWSRRRRARTMRNLVKKLGADLVIDYRKDEFEKRLQRYDVVLNSLGPDVWGSRIPFVCLKSGGKLISIAGPPDPAFAREIGASWFLRQAADAPAELKNTELKAEKARRRLFVSVREKRMGKPTLLRSPGLLIAV